MLGVVNLLVPVDQQLICRRLVLLVYENKDPEAQLNLLMPRNQFREYHPFDLSEPGFLLVLISLSQRVEGNLSPPEPQVLPELPKKEVKHNPLVVQGHRVGVKDIGYVYSQTSPVGDIECVHSQASPEVTCW